MIEHCDALAREFGYEKLHFLTGDIADYEGVTQVDIVVTLHACDTATDYALAKAVEWNAQAILSVPCCQHELNGQMHNEILEPVMKYGLLKERMAALITDGLRASLLEEAGYQVQVLEFIDMEHTPKNILLRAVKGSEAKRIRPKAERMKEQREQNRSNKLECGSGSFAQGEEGQTRAEKLRTCMEFLDVNPTLAKLLADQ